MANKKFKCGAPCFYTGAAAIAASGRNRVEYQGMMDERFKTFTFSRPLPMEHRRADFPQCGRCCARFLLEGTQAPQQAPVVAQWAPVAAPAAGSLLGFVRELEALAELRRQGLFCEVEFEFAKRRLLQEQ